MEWESSTGHSWFALQVRTNYEKVVQQLLDQKRCESYLPSYRERRTWSDRIKHIERPYFPGYVFCRIHSEERVPVLQTPNVINFVGIGRKPIPISEDEIASLKILVDSRCQTEPFPFLHIGQKVKIEKGPLAGVEGILQAVKTGYRIVVSISLLQRSVAAEMDRSWIGTTG